jgi:hypothetical protein
MDTRSTAEKLASQRAETAVVAALAPICVEKFQQQTDSPAKLVAFNKVSSLGPARQEGRGRRHLDVIGAGNIEGAVAADADIGAGRADQRASL